MATFKIEGQDVIAEGSEEFIRFCLERYYRDRDEQRAHEKELGQKAASLPQAVPSGDGERFREVVTRADLNSVTDLLLLACWWLTQHTGQPSHRTKDLTALCRGAEQSVGANPTATLIRLAERRWLERKGQSWSLAEVGRSYAAELAGRAPAKVIPLRSG